MDALCTRVIARRQPAASDLRMIVAVNKASSDLERIGYHSRNICQHLIYLVKGINVSHHTLKQIKKTVKD
ncbi:MAG: PhoU domain-containing protein [Motiliproteus sp.]